MTYTDWERREHIREIQEYLRTLALVDNNHNELAVDGIYGPETTEAVRQFQLANGLPVTGSVDSVTWERLVNDYLDALTLLTEAVAVQPFSSPQFILRRGDSGNEVYILQAILDTLGDVFQALPALIINGQYDQATAARVRALQAVTGFPETGEVDRTFWDHLATLYNNR